MGFLAALFLSYMPEEDAFFMFIAGALKKGERAAMLFFRVRE